MQNRNQVELFALVMSFTNDILNISNIVQLIEKLEEKNDVIAMINLVNLQGIKDFLSNAQFSQTDYVGIEHDFNQSLDFFKTQIQALPLQSFLDRALNLPFSCPQCNNTARQRCACCKFVYYCSRDCQIAHWKTHKPWCALNKYSQ